MAAANFKSWRLKNFYLNYTWSLCNAREKRSQKIIFTLLFGFWIIFSFVQISLFNKIQIFFSLSVQTRLLPWNNALLMSRNPKQKVVIYSLALLWATSADDSVNVFSSRCCISRNKRIIMSQWRERRFIIYCWKPYQTKR